VLLRSAGGSKGKPRGIMGKHGVMKYFTTPLAGALAAGSSAAVPAAFTELERLVAGASEWLCCCGCTYVPEGSKLCTL